MSITNAPLPKMPEPLENRGDEQVNSIRIGNVATHGRRTRTKLREHLWIKFLDVCEHNMIAIVDQAPSGGQPQTLGSTGHNRHVPAEFPRLLP
jgi:hypothetical protein